MKISQNTLLIVLAAIFVSIILSSCGVVDQTTQLYNEGQTKYVAVNVAYANAVACQTTENQTIEQTFSHTYSYNWSVVQQNENYRKAMNAPAEAAALAPKATAQDGSQVVDFSKLPAAASPDGIYKAGLSFSVYAVQEAQVIPVPPEVTLKAMDFVQVANQHKFQCFTSWNNTAGDYNTWAAKVPGRVMVELANYFGISEMPRTMPMFTGAGAQSVPGAAPNTTNPYAPTAPAVAP